MNPNLNGQTMNGNSVNGQLSSSMNSNNGLSQSPFGGGVFGLNGYEVQRLKDELIINKAKMTQWEDGMAQARNVRILSLFLFVCLTCALTELVGLH